MNHDPDVRALCAAIVATVVVGRFTFRFTNRCYSSSFNAGVANSSKTKVVCLFSSIFVENAGCLYDYIECVVVLLPSGGGSQAVSPFFHATDEGRRREDFAFGHANIQVQHQLADQVLLDKNVS